jgi:putative transposase
VGSGALVVVARKPREELAGGVYHVFARGNRKEPIFVDDEDRRRYLAGFGNVAEDLGWRCLSYCLMTNHVHHVVELRNPNLGAGIGLIHGSYARAFNDRHQTGGGHLFQKRYGATLARNHGALMYFVCYVLLNPVRAKLCERPQDFAWCSYAATAGLEPGPRWLDPSRTVSYFGRTARDPLSRFVEIVEAVRVMGAAGFEPATGQV